MKKINIVGWLILLIGLIIALCGISKEFETLIVVGIIIMLLSIIFRLVFYRCPHCNKFLDRSNGEYCPYCGDKI